MEYTFEVHNGGEQYTFSKLKIDFTQNYLE